MARVLFSVWFSIQIIIQNTTSNVWFRIQRIIRSGSGFRVLVKCPEYYSAYGLVFRVLFKMRPAASGSVFGVLLKMSMVLFSVWFSIQRIIKKCPGYYSASGSGFRVLLKNVQGIIQRLVQYSGNSFFIDREPAHFRLILNYLRGGCSFPSDAILPRDRRYLLEIKSECEFYRLKGLRMMVKTRLERLSDTHGVE